MRSLIFYILPFLVSNVHAGGTSPVQSSHVRLGSLSQSSESNLSARRLFARQVFCQALEKQCGIGCIRSSWTCCPDQEGGCAPTDNCQMGSNGKYGCCPKSVGTCIGGGGTDTNCRATEEICGQGCISFAEDCCADGTYCPASSRCWFASNGIWGCCPSGLICDGPAPPSGGGGTGGIDTGTGTGAGAGSGGDGSGSGSGSGGGSDGGSDSGSGSGSGSGNGSGSGSGDDSSPSPITSTADDSIPNPTPNGNDDLGVPSPMPSAATPTPADAGPGSNAMTGNVPTSTEGNIQVAGSKASILSAPIALIGVSLLITSFAGILLV